MKGSTMLIKRTIAAFLLGTSLVVAESSAASSVRKHAPTKATAKSNKSSEYSTSMSFEGASLKGKVQSGSLRRIVVENDKSLDDLLGVRKHFDDREQQEKGRVTSW